MFALLTAVLLAASSPAPASPAAQSQAPAPAAGGQPLRQVTYKVSQGTRTFSGGEHFQGYSSNSTATSDQGTVNVAVLSVSGDTLQVSVTETMNSTGRPATYEGTVLPDGSVNFGPDTIQDVTRQLLEFFGTGFEPKDKTGAGSTWDVGANRGGIDLTAHYGVTKVDGDLATVSVHETVKFAAQNASMTLEGMVVMKPALLVPVSGDLHRTIRRTTANGESQTNVSLQFQRQFDSLDPSAQ